MNEAHKLVFSVATFNTFGIPFFSPHPGKRFRLIGQAFEQLALDFINLQEVHTYDLLLILKQRLLSYPYVAYRPGLVGPKGGLVTFSRTKLSQNQFIPFTLGDESKGEKGSNFSGLRRVGALLSRLSDLPLIICNTHLIANRDGDWSRTNRSYRAHERNIEQLAALVRRFAQEEKELLITGDFNIPKCSELYLQFVKHAHVRDVFAKDEIPTFHADFLPPGSQSHCLDYIFLCETQKQVSINRAAFLFQEKVRLASGSAHYLSDHLGLMAELDGFL